MKMILLLLSVLTLATSALGQFQKQSPSAALESAARESAKKDDDDAEQHYSGLDILTPTHGVNLKPYLETVMSNIRRNWFRFIPASARAPEKRSPWRKPKLKQGKVTIEFVINRDGSLGDIRVAESSEDLDFDSAAASGISESAPFPHLPKKFSSDTLRLRCNFYYNPSHTSRPAK